MFLNTEMKFKILFVFVVLTCWKKNINLVCKIYISS